jgi:excisionase family DNA binding protein
MLNHIETGRGYITTPEAAKRTGLSTNYVATLLRRGILEGFRLAREWFVYIDSLEQYMATPHKPGPKGPRKQLEQEKADLS